MTPDYDQLTDVYSRHRQCHDGVLRELRDCADRATNTRVLEVGAGTGNYCRALRELTDCTCSAIDPSPAMLKVAQERNPELNAAVGTAEQIPFEALTFGLVFCVDVMHHLPDSAAFLREAHRVLSTAGTLCIVTDSEEIIRTRFPLAEYFPETVDPELSRYPSINSLERAASTIGFRSWTETLVSSSTALKSADAYEAKAFSALHLISDSAFERGLKRLKEDLRRGPLHTSSRYVILEATK